MKRHGWIAFLFLASIAYGALFQPSQNIPVQVNAGQTTYEWEIQRWLLENTNSIKPRLVQGQSELTAQTIIYDYQNEIGYAYGNVFYQNRADKVTLRAGEGVYYTKEKKIVVRRNPVIEMKSSGTVATSDVMTIYTEEDYIILSGNVVIKSSNYTMTGDRATYYQTTGSFKISGTASTSMNDTLLTADRIDIVTENSRLKSYTAIGNVHAVNTNEGYTIESGRLDYFKDLGYTRITENPVIVFHEHNMRAHSIVMEQFENEKKANLIGNVIIEQGDQRAYARWGEYYSDQKIMYLSGNPILASGGSKLNANRIMVDVDAGEMTMVGGGTGFYRYDRR